MVQPIGMSIECQHCHIVHVVTEQDMALWMASYYQAPREFGGWTDRGHTLTSTGTRRLLNEIGRVLGWRSKNNHLGGQRVCAECAAKGLHRMRVGDEATLWATFTWLSSKDTTVHSNVESRYARATTRFRLEMRTSMLPFDSAGRQFKPIVMSLYDKSYSGNTRTSSYKYIIKLLADRGITAYTIKHDYWDTCLAIKVG